MLEHLATSTSWTNSASIWKSFNLCGGCNLWANSCTLSTLIFLFFVSVPSTTWNWQDKGLFQHVVAFPSKSFRLLVIDEQHILTCICILLTFDSVCRVRLGGQRNQDRRNKQEGLICKSSGLRALKVFTSDCDVTRLDNLEYNTLWHHAWGHFLAPGHWTVFLSAHKCISVIFGRVRKVANYLNPIPALGG